MLDLILVYPLFDFYIIWLPRMMFSKNSPINVQKIHEYKEKGLLLEGQDKTPCPMEAFRAFYFLFESFL